MSLIDAVLVNDPVPGEIWIAIRPPEVRGSGSENDPFNGARANHQILTVSGIDVAVSGENYVVTITASVAHGFQANDRVLIMGISHPDGELLNGCFSVTPVGGQAAKFTYTVIFSPLGMHPPPTAGTSTPSGVTCQRDPFLFDAVMLELAARGKPVTVRLGPGVFETKGYSDLRSSVSWAAFADLKLRGAGIGVTTLKLSAASYRNRHYWVIGMPTLPYASNTADNFSATDFTIDCNSFGQLTTQVTCGAVALRGSHTRLSRLRAINFGRLGPGERVDTTVAPPVLRVVTPELFVFSVGGSTWMNNNGRFQSKDCVIEDCVAERPDPNSYRESTMMIVSGGVFNTDAKIDIPTVDAAFLRNYFNGDYEQSPIQITTATGAFVPSPDKIVVTVTTAQPHGLAEQQWVRVSGVRIAPTTSPGNGYTTNLDGYANFYNGSFKVTQILSDTQFKYENPGATSAPSITSFEGAWLNRWPSDYIKVKLIKDRQGPVNGKYSVEVETLSPHFLIERGTSAALPVGCVAVIDGMSPDSSQNVDTINQPWFVTQWISNTRFRCERDFEGRTPATLPDPGVPNNFGKARIGAKWQAMTAANRIEGNVVRNCTVAGHYIDSYGVRNTGVRNNVYSNVRTGMYVTLKLSGQGVEGNPDSDTGMPSIRFISIRTTTNPNRWFALFELRSNTTQASSVPRPHFWGVGQAVLIRKATKAGQDLDLFNRSFKIASIPSREQFEIELDSNPTTNLPDNQPTYPTVNWLWMSRGLVFENNTVEMLPALWLPGANEGVSSLAFSIDGTIDAVTWMGSNKIPPWPSSPRQFFRHLSAIFRKNVVRYGTLPNGATRTGVPFQEACVSNQSVESALLVGNTIDLDWRDASTHETPLLQVDSNLGYFLNNYSSAARFVPGTNRSVGNRWEGGLNHLVEDAATLGFL